MLRNRQQGIGIAGLFAFTFLCTMVVFALYAMGTSHIRFSAKMLNRSQAQDAADSALTVAIHKLKQDINFEEEVSYRPEGMTCEGRVTFTGEYHSTNNLVGDASVTGWNETVVPGHVAHLIGVGNHANETVVREVFIHIPPFPYAVASEGRLHSSGSLEVFALESIADLEDGVLDEEKMPGHIVSNAPDERSASGSLVTPAVLLGEDTSISGDAQAVGSVHLIPFNGSNPDASAAAARGVVDGQVRPGHDREALPQVAARDFDPTGATDAYEFQGEDELSGRAWHRGDLELTDDVDLQDSLLYVDGDLVINGNLSGVGAIVCTGNITVRGSMNVASDKVALVADGDVSIQGEGRFDSSFQGLVYAGGSFTAADTQIVGAFVSADPETGTRLHNVRSVHVPELTSFEIVDEGPLPSSAPEPLEAGEGLNIPTPALESFSDGNGGYLTDPQHWPADAIVIQWTNPATAETRTYNSVEELVTDGGPRFSAHAYFNRIQDAWLQELSQRIQLEDGVGSSTVFQLDLNQFLRLSDQITVLLWR